MAIKRRPTARVQKVLGMFLTLILGHTAAQVPSDSLEQWMAGFASYANVDTSETQRWVAATKIYSGNSDTVQIYDAAHPGAPVLNLVKKTVKRVFLADDALIVQSVDTAEYIGLPEMRRISYSKVKKTDVLSFLKQYVILDHAGMLNLYDSDARVVLSVPGVSDYITDGKQILLAVVNDNTAKKIVQFTAGRMRDIYQTPHHLREVPGFSLGRYAAFTEQEEQTGKIRSVVIDLKTGRAHLPLDTLFIEADFIRITQILGADSFLIDYEKRIKTYPDPVVDLWYTDDPHLSSRKKGRDINQYWLWTVGSEQARKLPQNIFDVWVPVSNRYLLAFSRAEKFDYRYSFPIYPLYLVDSYKLTKVKISEGTREVVISGNGKYLAVLNGASLQWDVINVLKGEKSRLDGNDLRMPFFTSDEKSLVFESDNGLWVYNLALSKFTRPLLEGYHAKIEKRSAKKIYEKDGASFTAGFENVVQGMLIQTHRNGLSGCFQWFGGRVSKLIPETEYARQQLRYNRGSSNVVAVEEFYNHAPQLYMYDRHTKTRITLDSGAADSHEKGLIRKKFTFRNSLGRELKGILYYPQRFHPDKKYPMVVRIYQDQGGSANKYPYPHYSGDGFNMRLLIEKGYFVYLPDTVVDERGAGIAAVDCVHSAMAAVQDHPNIDLERVGLIGHSFGGYETNFIAGQSKMFCAYVSGAGMSDLTRRYLEFNDAYGINEYARIENGQFEMKAPFADAKQKYYANNPVFFADAIAAPILLWAGMKDRNVRYEHTMAMYTALVRNRKDAVALLYPQGDHVLEVGSREARDLNVRILQWWDYFLKNQTDIPWINKQMSNVGTTADECE